MNLTSRVTSLLFKGTIEIVGFPSFVGLINLLNMVLLFWHVPWLVHDSWQIQHLFWRAWFLVLVWSFQGKEKVLVAFFFGIYHLGWLSKKAIFRQSLVQEKFSLLLLHFGATKISKFVLQVSNVSSLDI